MLIVTMLIYDNTHTRVIREEVFSLDGYFKDPQKYGDRYYEAMVKIINISNDHLYANIGDKDVKITGSEIKRPVLGETVVYLHYKKDGIIELIDYHNYNHNYILYGISFFALILFVVIFLKEWKFTRRGFKDA